MPNIPVRSVAFRLGLSGLLATGVVTVVAPTAFASGCIVDAGTRHVSVFAGDMDAEVKLRVNAGNLDANGQSCGALTEIDTVGVDMAASPSGTVTFDLSDGSLGPGFTDEGDGSSEIEFAVTGQGANGLMTVTGSAENDGITIGANGSEEINLNAGAEAGSPDADVTFSSRPLSIYVDGNAGDDTISAAGVPNFDNPYRAPVNLSGGTGTNSIAGGYANDTLRIVTEVVSTGRDTVSGGDGGDQVEIATESDTLTSAFSLDGIANDGVGCPGAGCEGDNLATDIEVIVGSVASETITGGDGRQVIRGGGGLDVLRGFGGEDYLDCTGGKAFGGAGYDRLEVSLGCAAVSGGGGRDTATFLSSTARVKVTLDGLKNDGSTRPRANVRMDIENVQGSDFGITIVGNSQANVLLGGKGRDNLSGGFGPDSIVGYGGNDTLSGGDDDDSLLGGARNDTLSGDAGDDSLDGGVGIDVCDQGTGTGLIVNCE